MGFRQTSAKPTVAVATTANYVAGDCVGGKLTVSGAGLQKGAGATLTDLLLIDPAGGGADLTLYFFAGDLSGGTYTDNAAAAFSAADRAKMFARVRLDADTDYTAVGTPKFGAPVNGCGPQVGVPLESADVYLVIVAEQTVNYGTSGLTVRPGFFQD